jgi:hypothetical protein
MPVDALELGAAGEPAAARPAATGRPPVHQAGPSA